MDYSIGDVARLAGVSTRTLRHYDDLGLLAPSYVAGNGYRRYGRRELLRLQRILLLRRLRVPLDQVQRMLDGQANERAALAGHREELLAEREELDRIVATVDRTMAALAGERPVRDEEFFDGLRQEKHQLQERLASRYGPAAREQFASAETAMSGWDRTDYDQAAEQGRELLGRMSMTRARGVRAEDPEALDLVAEHYRQVRAVWPADASSYRGLADLIEQDPQQRGLVAEVDPDLPHWLASAIRAYVARRLQ